ncbi:MAG: putative 2-dehydropantoate 2-reductase [Sedimentisphaerales bacterium]|nr:putative 2-dehydropantoate 2-reductase [Sedimentisphaerales bacterium]
MSMQSEPMRIAIVGAGALGSFYGGLLAKAGYDVHFLLRRDYPAVRRHGLTVRSVWGDFQLPRVNCYRDVGRMGTMDLVFIGLKTTANDRYGELVGPLMGPDSLALSAQNGLGNEERLAELFGPPRVAGGLAFLCCNRQAPGVICHLDYGFLSIGNYRRGPDGRLERLGAMLQRSGVDCRLVEDLEEARWKKLIWNVPFNGLSTLLDQKVDAIMHDPARRRRAWRLMREVQAAARSQGKAIEDGFLEHMMELTDKMEPYFTSMHLDRRAGRPLETEAIVGEPLRRGRAGGVELPEMQLLYDGLRALETDREGGA